MYHQPYFMPNFYSTMAPSMIRRATIPSFARGFGINRGVGLFSRIGNSLGALKAINWGGIINNTSKTLGIINQTIPLVRQVGPMMNNMRSMLRIASIFKDETDRPIQSKNHHATAFSNSSVHEEGHLQQHSTFDNTNLRDGSYESTSVDDYSPTFFIGS